MKFEIKWKGFLGATSKQKSHPAASIDIFFFLALNKSNNVFARGPTSDVLQTQKGDNFIYQKVRQECYTNCLLVTLLLILKTLIRNSDTCISFFFDWHTKALKAKATKNDLRNFWCKIIKVTSKSP